MKKLNKKPKILNTNDAKTFAAKIRDLEDEIEEEELHSDDKFDWRSIKVGEVGSDCKTQSNNGPQKRLHIAVVAE